MLAMYKAHEEFLFAEINALGKHADFAASQDSAVESIRETLPTLPRDMKDASETLKALKEPSLCGEVFTEAHRRQISNEVAAHMRSSATIAHAKLDDTKLQNHSALADAYTKTLYDILCDDRVEWVDKLGATAMHCVKVLGLKNPNDKTCKQAVAIAAACSQRPMGPEDAYNDVFKFKSKIEAERELYPCAQTYKEFPKDVSVFVKAFPQAFPEWDPPVCSRVDALKIKEMMRKENMPTRSSNKAIAGSVKPRQSSGSRCYSQAEGDPLGSALASYLLGRSNQLPPAALTDSPPPQHKPPCAALMDATLPPKRDAAAAPDAPKAAAVGVPTGGGLDDVLNMGKELAATKKANGKKKKGGKKKDDHASSADSGVPN